MASWEAVTAMIGVLVALGTAIGGIAKQARVAGRHEEHMKQIDRTVREHTDTIAGHTAELAKGDGNFQTIDSKLENIIKSQDDLKRGQEATQTLIIKHITDGAKV